MCIFGRKGASGFSSSSTAEQVTHGIDGTGLTAIVTGASSGIGAETARVLALRGVHVIIAGIAMEDSREVKESILKDNPDAKIDVMLLDLSSMTSIKSFASEYISKGLPLNILVNNAGIYGNPFTLSRDGIELHFATNYLGHFLLTELLLDTMKRSARESNREGRIVNVASVAHYVTYREGILFDRINDESSYNTALAYAQSKLASILHANELARCLKANGVDIIANSVHPGLVYTNIYQHNKVLGITVKIAKFLSKNIAQGAATSCYVALNPQVKGVSGEYFVDSNIAQPSSQAKNVELAKKLWDFSFNLTNS